MTVSSFGRGFARCGGLAEAVKEALLEQGVTDEMFKLDPIVGDGLAECKKLLAITKSGKMKSNFIEGMACKNGCVGGPACLTHNPRALAQLARHQKEATGTIHKTGVGEHICRAPKALDIRILHLFKDVIGDLVKAAVGFVYIVCLGNYINVVEAEILNA